MVEPRDPPDRPAFDTSELMQKLQAKRRARDMSLRDVADVTGVSVPTLSRVLRGHVPDRENLLRLAGWVGMSIAPAADQHARRDDRVHSPDADTVEAVELHLRADRNLRGEDAEALAALFKIAYDRLRDRSEGEL